MERINFKVLMLTILFISVAGMIFFSMIETFRHFSILSNIDVVNFYGIFLIFGFLGGALYFGYEENIGIAFLVMILIAFFCFIGADFSEINNDEYKKIENIDKAAIKNVIGEKTYVSRWDYLNILENQELERRAKLNSLKQQQFEETKNKVLK